LVVLAVLALIGTSLPAGAAAQDLAVPSEVTDQIAAAKARTVYIVEMADDPVISYDGGVAGLAATAPARGKKINPNSGAVKKYVDYLDSAHAAAASQVGATRFYDYRYSFNGFAAVMTGQQAQALRTLPGVLAVWADELRQPVTDNSPDFLGLTDPSGGLWEDLGLTGEDVIVGVIDTGIWPEHPSFSDQIDLADRPGASGKRTLAYGPPPSDWHGTCQSGELWSQNDCNNKLIGARYFKDGFTNLEINFSTDYLSARDRDGHGSHTASTAAGNAGVSASIFGVDRGTISGIAPRARVAAYKACWADVGCASSDLVAAIDTAVADGVDVINYSIGGGSTSLVTPDAVSFLFAADAGVRVAVSAGNSGPGASTVGNPAVVPWVTSVGASTQNRTFQGSVTLGNSAQYFGASVTDGTGSLPLVDAADLGNELCLVGTGFSESVAGKIVLCKRGVNARVEKSHAVFNAGGAGTILYNSTATQTLNTDNHWTPTVHISLADGLAIKTYIDGAGAGATAQIGAGAFTPIPAPWMADFSSRGPNGGSMDIIKPDITAPGVNILAGNSPNPFLGFPGQLFQAISGTSMSSPHTAGVFALLAEAHPDWSPAITKSAIMTTAYQAVQKEDGATPADPFDFGGGHLNPNPAVDPGLAYDAGLFEYIAFLCGATDAVNPALCGLLESLGFSFDASDLNLASIGVAELAGLQTVTRTVTNVGSAGTYKVSVSPPAGIDVVVNPSSLTLAAGESASYEVTFTTTGSATLDQWVFGSLTWSDGTHDVRSPLAVKPVAMSVPNEVLGEGTDGSLSFDVVFGYTGSYTPEPRGLVAADQQADNVVDDPSNDINTALSTGVGITVHLVTIPTGTIHARFSLFDDFTDGNDDLDLYVFDPNGSFVGGSGSPTATEEVNVSNPAAGDWFVVVHGWQTDGPDANYTLFSWAIDGDAGNMTVSGPAAVLGATGTVDVTWSGLSTGTKYLGAVLHTNPTATDPLTFVRIDTD
jgi:subtilisin family serine protease